MIRIRSAFFRIFVKLFGNYNDYFIKSNTSTTTAATTNTTNTTTSNSNSMYNKLRKSITSSTITDNSIYASDDNSVINFSTHSSSISLISTTTTATNANTSTIAGNTTDCP